MIRADKFFYDSFLESATKLQWQKIGIARRAGVCVPLFSLHSQNSLGIGEIPDLKLLIDWCKHTGLSIIQLLPLNDTGFNFTPYDSESSFALDPMYLSLDNLLDAEIGSKIKKEIAEIKTDTDFNGQFVNYKIKKIKLEMLWKIFRKANLESNKFSKFIQDNKFWLTDYALYKAIKDSNWQTSWDKWDEKSAQAVPERVKFYEWLQWQLFEQFKAVKEYAHINNVLIFGDIPLFVSYDSADVWANQKYFHLDRASGVPPDALSDKGQRWGMPTYNWEELAKNNYDYYVSKLKYAENFYDIFRIDHAIGLFRTWSVDSSDALENGSKNGRFDPPHEEGWQEQGRRLYQMIINNTMMLPCAEDLGAVPDSCYRALSDFAIPGIEVQRWQRNANSEFRHENEYRKNSMAVISTHDMSHFALWWQAETNSDEKNLFAQFCKSFHNSHLLTTQQMAKKAIEKAHNSASIFSIQLMHDWLALANFDILHQEKSRINFPGLVLENNWSIRMPISLEELNEFEMNHVIRSLNDLGDRVVLNKNSMKI